MPTICGEYLQGGGHYPAWADGISEMPAPEAGEVLISRFIITSLLVLSAHVG